MSDSYEIGGVTITPQPGGYYELRHPSLPDPEKVRGKEAADTRAQEIHAAAEPPEGSMPAQPPIDAVPVPPAAQPDPAAPPAPDIATLAALVERQAAMIEQLLANAATTVIATEAPAPSDPRASIPRAFAGQVSDEVRAAAAALGVQYVTIVLEEGPDIPPTGLFLGHNGRSYQISPGEEVDVPDFLLGILDDAIMSTPVVDSKTQKVLGYRNRTKYPYRRITS